MKHLAVQVLLAGALLHLCWSYRLERVGDARFVLSEGPHWNDENGMLYFVDIHNAGIGRYNPDSKIYYSAKVEGVKNVGFIIPVARHPGLFIIGADLSVLLIEWDGCSETVKPVKELSRIENRPPSDRFNDGKADFQGRLVAGTMLEKSGPSNDELLISIQSDLKSQTLISNSGLSNGIAWDRSRGKMYHCDSDNSTVTQYDYDERTGKIHNPEVLFVVSDPIHGFPKTALPDGLNIDTDGNLYIALFNGSRIVQFDPVHRMILQQIMLPTPQVTSMSWGGRNMNKLYVTTAAQSFNDEPNTDDNAGRIYVVRGLNRKGFKCNKFVVDETLLHT